MQPPPRKVKVTQEVKVRFGEQLSSLQNKQQQETDLLEDIRSFSKQRAAIEREYGQALQRLASQYLKRDWNPGKNEPSGIRSVFVVWKSVVEGAASVGQARVTAAENYRNLTGEAAKTARTAKEHLLKKSTEQLAKVQMELMETMKELSKTKKRYGQLERVFEVAREKAMDTEARLKRSDHGIFHSKTSLQKLSAKFSTQLAGCTKQLGEARNEYILTLAAANAHVEHYYLTELPAVMKFLDGDLYDRLRNHLTLISKTELETCQLTQKQFRGILEASKQVSREQNLQLFLQDATVFNPTPAHQFQPSGTDKVCHLETWNSSQNGESGLEKEARRWASRAARDYKLKAHGERILLRLEARRQKASEEEALGMGLKIEEVKEGIRKAEINKIKADARIVVLRQANVDVDTWLSGAMGQANEELEQERRLSETRMSNGDGSPAIEEFDLTEFEDFDDTYETFEESSLSLSGTRSYPLPCRVRYGYQASQTDELSIVQGEQLEIIEDGDVEEWVKARNKSGQVGYVPEKYLAFINFTYSNQMMIDGTSKDQFSGISLSKELTGMAQLHWTMEPGECLARALYDYEGQSAEELTFPEGAIIQVLQKEEGGIDDGFWKGEFNGQVGVFPSLMVEEIVNDGSELNQELPSPAPPPFSPPPLFHGADPRIQLHSSSSASEVILGGQDGPSSTQMSTDLAPSGIRPLRAPPPPPTRQAEDNEEHYELS
ncbi:F-BAR and double SH3 domains protein 1 [Microcaecilia unicolor]|uniref:F-BAR and double SH3 domains protein 1 n=1 Tax=Microcaecilia unicolor TaxID=1415580 RepID=A0A6P7YQ98_9AMPH|nr:F-BAR and double SH3 domains protein 1 [Microcaecilia unicolor]